MVVTCADVFVQDRDAFSLKLEDTENWLYEEGEDQQKQVYIDKLAELKVNTSVFTWIQLQTVISIPEINKSGCVVPPT